MAPSWQRVPNTLYVMKHPLYCLPHFVEILFEPCSPLPSTFTSTAIFDVLFSWLKGYRVTFDALFYLMKLWILDMLSLGTAVRDMYFIPQSSKFTEVWHKMPYFAGTLIWYHKHIYPQRHTTHSGANRLTHPINIY